MRNNWWTRGLRGLSVLIFVILVAACGGGGGGDDADDSGAISADTSPPSVPTGLTATAVSAAQIDLAWTASTDDVGVWRYEIYRGGTLLTSATGTAWQNTGLTDDTQYCYTIAAVNTAGNSSVQGSPVCATTSGPRVKQPLLNDTGITTWGNFNDNTLTASPAGFPGQDADFGRDAKARAGTLIKVGGGSGGFDFTKLDSNGNALAVSAATWSCVRDNHTGLIWEIKTDDGGLRDKDHTYSWYNPDPTINGGNAGNLNGGVCTGGIECDTAGYVAAINAAGLCGVNDWRLPSVEELRSIVDNSKRYPGPTIDSDYFPNTISNAYSTISTRSVITEQVWDIVFSVGQSSYTSKNSHYYLRLVRGGQ